MGESRLKASVTQKLIAEHPECYFCGGTRAATTREHMPPKALFDNSHRPDKLVMPACSECNRKTSTADLVAAVVSRWSYYRDKTEGDDHKRLLRQIRIQHPVLIDEWTKLGPVGRKKAKQHLRSFGVQVPYDAGIATIGPETIRYLNLFAHKAVLALYFEHFRRPLPPSGGLCAYWKSKEDFAKDGVPEEILEILPKWASLAQGRWDTREIFQYRFDVNPQAGLFGCLAKLRNGLFVVGFAATDPSILTPDVTNGQEWLCPADADTLLALERFRKKL